MGSETKWCVGDRAVIDRHTVVTIERITPSGRVVAGGRTFNPDGSERPSGRLSWIEPLTQEIEDEMALVVRGRNARRDADSAVYRAERWIRSIITSFRSAIPDAADVDKAERLAAAINGCLDGEWTAPGALDDGWRPIETAPKDGTSVWVYAAEYDDLPAFQCVCAWHEDAGWCVDDLRPVTHWRPLPPPPEQRATKEPRDE